MFLKGVFFGDLIYLFFFNNEIVTDYDYVYVH